MTPFLQTKSYVFRVPGGTGIHKIWSSAALLVLAPVALAAPAAKTTTGVAASANPTVGVPVTLTATVTPAPGGGTVGFKAGGVAISGCTANTVTSGRSTCTTTFTTAGSRTITATYTGTTSFTGSTGRVVVKVAASAKGKIVGSLGGCTRTSGALVAVSYAAWNGPVVRGCDTTPTTGIELLTTAGFTTAGTQHDGPAFICRIGHPLFDGGRQYPTPAQDPCAATPPADAYWSYWLADRGSNTWRYASLGAYSNQATNGEVEAWTFGSTDISGTTGQPAFTPSQIRNGLPAA